MHQLLIVLFIVIEWNDGNSIIKLIAKAVDCVVNDDEVFDILVLYDTQVLDVDPFRSFDAVVSVQSKLHKLLLPFYFIYLFSSIWSLHYCFFVIGKVLKRLEFSFKHIENFVCVRFVTSRENNNLIELVSFLQALIGIRSDVNSCLYSFACWESDIYFAFIWEVFNVIYAVDKCFIKVEDQSLLMLTWRQHYTFGFDDRFIWWTNVLHVLQALKSLHQVIFMHTLLLLIFLLFNFSYIILYFCRLALFWFLCYYRIFKCALRFTVFRLKGLATTSRHHDAVLHVLK